MPGVVARLARALRVPPGVFRVPVFAQRRVPRPRRRHAGVRREAMASVPAGDGAVSVRVRARGDALEHRPRDSRNVIRARDTARDVTGVPSVGAYQDAHRVRRRAVRNDRRSGGLVARGARCCATAARRRARRGRRRVRVGGGEFRGRILARRVQRRVRRVRGDQGAAQGGCGRDTMSK